MSLILQLVGAVLILAPFAWSTLGSLSLQSRVYLALNLAGSSLLASVAVAGQQWGFVVLELTWAMVSAASLVRSG
jgi:hypothetical protein